MDIDYNVIATGLIVPIAVFLVNKLLDFSLAHIFVKYFWWLPVRGLLRDKPPNISGEWFQHWVPQEAQILAMPPRGKARPKLGSLVGTVSPNLKRKRVTYRLFGRIKNSYLVGEWYEVEHKIAYFGTF